MPGAVSIFAEAVAGGDTAKLFKMMENGEVKSDALVGAAQVAARRAREGGALGLARNSMTAQQARFGNTLDRITMRMNDKGLNSAFANIFGSLAEMADDLAPLGDLLVTITKAVSDLVSLGTKVTPSLGNILGGLNDIFEVILQGWRLIGSIEMPDWVKNSTGLLGIGSLVTTIEWIILTLGDFFSWMAGTKETYLGKMYGDFSFNKLFDLLWDSIVEGVSDTIDRINNMLAEKYPSVFGNWSSNSKNWGMENYNTALTHLTNPVLPPISMATPGAQEALADRNIKFEAKVQVEAVNEFGAKVVGDTLASFLEKEAGKYVVTR